MNDQATRSEKRIINSILNCLYKLSYNASTQGKFISVEHSLENLRIPLRPLKLPCLLFSALQEIPRRPANFNINVGAYNWLLRPILSFASMFKWSWLFRSQAVTQSWLGDCIFGSTKERNDKSLPKDHTISFYVLGQKRYLSYNTAYAKRWYNAMLVCLFDGKNNWLPSQTFLVQRPDSANIISKAPS